ncbi:MAG: class I SAM-dependent methyltransferase [Deltaproteobacteria bacterium]|nr:class I SAM-dependent methyltransferase [Deltaproteobacteria bacterium]
MKHKFTEGLLDNKKILEKLDIKKGYKVLDAGCGNGYMSKKFTKLVGNAGTIYALDTDKAFIEALKKETAKTSIIAVVGDITSKTPLEDSSLDLIYLSTVFHIFKPAQIEGFIKEVKRLLRPGARLAVININKEETDFGPPMEMRLSHEELRQKLPFVPKGLFDVGKYFYMQLFENSK